ncbi:hypothetical protein HK11_11025 [Acetobacter sp. DmW_043]|nr:hypothetical protein HK11_11025 [Acetobacter sp. DmW_043]
MAVVMEAFDSCFPDRAVHSLDLTIGPGMIEFRQTMFEKFPGCSSVGFVHKLRYRKLAFSDLDFGNIEVKEPDRIAPEVLLFRLTSFDIRQA